jgi:hypothetical protein
MSLIILVSALMSTAWVARLLRPEHAVLLSPALTIIGWSIAIEILVSRNVTVEAIWLPFWLCTGGSFAVSIYVMRRDLSALALLTVPALCTMAVLAPYFLYGIATYPGSWFWDGFAYLALGETYWSHPRNEPAQDMELFFALGRTMFYSSRLASPGLLSMFRGIIPLGGDSRAAIGYFLILAVFAFSCSCTYLARGALPKQLQIAFVVIATISGPVLNLVWVNNFDQLLALSIAPALTGYAMQLQWGRKRDALLLGLGGASLTYIYPEMTPFLALPAVLVLLFKAVKERPGMPLLSSAGIAIGLCVLVIAPMISDIQVFLSSQLATRAVPIGARPGSGYFSNLLHNSCMLGSAVGLYDPFQPCADWLTEIPKSIIGLILIAAACVGIRKRRDGIAAAAVCIGAVAMFFMFAERYDYGAYKVITSGCYAFTILIVSAFTDVRRSTLAAGAAVAATSLLLISDKISRFDQMVAIKDISPFQEVAEALPKDATIELKISDPLLFEWSAYYLRFHKTVAVVGQLIYFPSPSITIPAVQKRISAAQYLLTDKNIGEDHLVWSNGFLYAYQIAPSS